MRSFRLRLNPSLLLLLLQLSVIFSAPITSQAQEPSTYDDPFYNQKGVGQIIAGRGIGSGLLS